MGIHKGPRCFSRYANVVVPPRNRKTRPAGLMRLGTALCRKFLRVPKSLVDSLGLRVA